MSIAAIWPASSWAEREHLGAVPVDRRREHGALQLLSMKQQVGVCRGQHAGIGGQCIEHLVAADDALQCERSSEGNVGSQGAGLLPQQGVNY
jgi:hypothetical protein